MRTVRKEDIEELYPFIKKMDAELEKPQAERKDFRIKVPSAAAAKTLKGRIETLKQQYYRDRWLGRFQIWQINRDGHYLEFRFNVTRKVSYTIMEDGVAGFEIVDDAPAATENTIKELSEMDASMEILSETPKYARYDMAFFKPETQDYFNEPTQVENAPALANLLKARDYKWEVKDSILHVRLING